MSVRKLKNKHLLLASQKQLRNLISMSRLIELNSYQDLETTDYKATLGCTIQTTFKDGIKLNTLKLAKKIKAWLFSFSLK